LIARLTCQAKAKVGLSDPPHHPSNHGILYPLGEASSDTILQSSWSTLVRCSTFLG
jgi:hypothetical protein